MQGASCMASRVMPSNRLARSVCTQGLFLLTGSKSYVATKRTSQRSLYVKYILNTNSPPGSGDGLEPPSMNRFGLGSTRLGRLVLGGQQQLLQRWKTLCQNFPTRIFLLLFGYYSANAFATILGQTGDWDVLAAGLIVAVIEGIGYLMYRVPPFIGEKVKDVVEFVNYWKAGFSFGLFVDAFKLGS